MIYSSYATISLTNCLLDRVIMTNTCNDGKAPYIRNCLFRGGSLDIAFTNTAGLIQDNLFDGTLLNDQGNTSYTGDYNAYIIGSNYLTLTNELDQFLSNSPAYQSGALGNYYLPTNATKLINQGSTNANLLNFYLYCTTTNQLAETNSIVDIGYHYAALNPIGVPTNLDITSNMLLYYSMTNYVPITIPDPSGNYHLTLTDVSGYTGSDTAFGNVTGNVNPIIWRPNQTAFYTGAIHGRETVIDTSNTTRFDFTTNLFTINLWVQPLVIDNQPTIIGNGINTNSGWLIGVNPSGYAFIAEYNLNAGVGIFDEYTQLSPAEWAMLTFVRTNTSTVLIYVNGVLDPTVLYPPGDTFTNPDPSTNSLLIGCGHAFGGGYISSMDGDMGVVRIYSNILSSDQIYQLFTNGQTGVVR